jgi:hypothetical protein
MGPIAQANGHYGPGLSLQLVPGVAAVIHESIDVIEHAVGEPVVADELPDVLLRVQLGTLGRQRDDGDVVGYHELAGEMPSSLVYQQHRDPLTLVRMDEHQACQVMFVPPCPSAANLKFCRS